MLYTETIDAQTLDLIKKLMADKALDNFNLVGGTSLSLQIGHRKSIDIDLFSSSGFDAQTLRKHIENNYQADFKWQARNAMGGQINNIKVDIMSHQYPLVKPVQIADGIRLVSLEDIAAMKLNAITRDGNRPKDFVDIYALLEHKPLKEWTDAYEQKYPDVSKFMAHQSLLYYKEIDFGQLSKDMTLKEFDWKKIIERLKQAVNDPKKIFQSISKDSKMSLEQKIKQEKKLSNELKQSSHLKKSQSQKPHK